MTVIRETTRITWKPDLEIYQCEKCGKIMHYNFGFRYCPYCRRRIVRRSEVR